MNGMKIQPKLVFMSAMSQASTLVIWFLSPEDGIREFRCLSHEKEKDPTSGIKILSGLGLGGVGLETG